MDERIKPIRDLRAEAEFDRLDAEVASLIKGMIARGDKQSDIAACFMINGGRISEINTGVRFPAIAAAAPELLPPRGPYPSPYELWKTRHALWRVRVALEATAKTLQEAIVAVHKAEQR